MNIKVRVSDEFPETIRAFISRQPDYYILGINGNLKPEEQAAAAAHELYHVFSGDIDKRYVDEIEQNVPGRAQNPFYSA